MNAATPDAPDTPATAPAPPRRPRSGLARLALGLLGVVGGLLGLLALVGATLLWLSAAEAPSRWLLQQAPGVEAEGIQGALAGPSLSVARLRVALPGGARLEVDNLRLDNPRWTLRPHPGAWLGLELVALSATRVQVWPGRAAATPESPQPPDSLRLPLALNARALAVDRLQWGADTVAQGLRGALALGADGGARHRLQLDALRAAGVQASGALVVDTAAPLAVQAEAALSPVAAALPATPPAAASASAAASAPTWQARVSARGPLRDLALEATARAAAPASAALDLQTRVRPFARWPLAQLFLSTRELDLASLWPAAPRTALTGRLTLDTGGLDMQAELALTLENALPGRLDEQRLPLQRLALQANAVPRQPQQLTLSRLEAQWADRQGPHGTLSGEGRWGPEGVTLDTRWVGVHAQRVDARAAAVRVDGSFTLRGTGLPTPDTLGETDAAARLARAPWRWTADLQGQPAPGRGPAPPRVSLQAQGLWQAGVAELNRLQAQAGGASVQAEGRIALPAAGARARLQARSRGELKDFDPAVWWAGPDAAPWRRGAQRLSVQWTGDVALPWPWPGALAAWRSASGNLQLKAPDNLWAGQPLDLSADLGLGAPLGPGAADGTDARLVIDLRAGDNTLAARLNGSGADRLDLLGEFTLNAPQPAALAPWMAPWSGLAAAWPRAGQAEGRATVAGRWPALRTEGRLEASGLIAARGALGRGTAQWQVGSELNAPLSVSLQLADLRLDDIRLPRADVSLQGTAAEHRATWQAEAPLQAPAALQRALGRTSAPGLRFSGEARGGWLARGPQWWPAQGWRGQVQALQVADLPSADGAARPANAARRAAAAGPWLLLQPATAQGVAVEVALADDGALRSLRVQAGAARVADTALLRWEALAQEAGAAGAPARWQARATVDPVAVAPLLDRLQPEIRWSGDLRMRARLQVDAGERFATEVVLEREAGDLSIGRDTLEGGSLPLGLSDLRLAVTAQDGTWYFTQAFAGTRLGELAGAQSVTTTAGARWPEPTAPLDGVLQGRVANLGVWGAWVPPGWRLSGSLQSTASFGGRFGAPEVTGSLVGQNLGARQVLQGIAVSDGELRVALEGERARIETLRLRAGEGEVRVQGGALLGANPRADLRLVAERFRVLGRVDRRLVVSGQAALGLTRDSLQLDGAFGVDEGLVDFSRGDAPTLDSDVTVIRADTPPREDDEAVAAPPEALRRAEVALTLNLGERLRVVGRGLQTRLRGELAFSLPGGRPQLRGTVRAEEGQYAAYGQKLEITRGDVRFTGAPDNPQLDILAIRPNLDVTVGVSITGAARNPRIRLTSDPELAEYDKLSWLVLGRAPDGLGRTDTALLQRAAVALLAGESEGNAVTDPLLGALSLDDLSVRQTEGEVRETILSLGKQLSRRWYVGYERSVNATTGTWQLIYRAAQRFTLRAQSGEDSSLDVIWTWRWGP